MAPAAAAAAAAAASSRRVDARHRDTTAAKAELAWATAGVSHASSSEDEEAAEVERKEARHKYLRRWAKFLSADKPLVTVRCVGCPGCSRPTSQLTFLCAFVCVCVAHSLFLRCGRSIPWPPGGPGNIFCLPDAPGRRKLLMAEQRRWHPDSFQRLLASAGEPRPRDAELARIQTRAAAVARALNTELSAVSADPP